MSDHKMKLDQLVKRYGPEIHVDLWYPEVTDECKVVEIDLMCVRASNSLRVQFDHERNGFVLTMEEFLAHTSECSKLKEPTYVEVGFVPAWAAGEKVCDECKVDPS